MAPKAKTKAKRVRDATPTRKSTRPMKKPDLYKPPNPAHPVSDSDSGGDEGDPHEGRPDDLDPSYEQEEELKGSDSESSDEQDREEEEEKKSPAKKQVGLTPEETTEREGLIKFLVGRSKNPKLKKQISALPLPQLREDAADLQLEMNRNWFTMKEFGNLPLPSYMGDMLQDNVNRMVDAMGGPDTVDEFVLLERIHDSSLLPELTRYVDIYLLAFTYLHILRLHRDPRIERAEELVAKLLAGCPNYTTQNHAAVGRTIIIAYKILRSEELRAWYVRVQKIRGETLGSPLGAISCLANPIYIHPYMLNMLLVELDCGDLYKKEDVRQMHDEVLSRHVVDPTRWTIDVDGELLFEVLHADIDDQAQMDAVADGTLQLWSYSELSQLPYWKVSATAARDKIRALEIETATTLPEDRVEVVFAGPDDAIPMSIDFPRTHLFAFKVWNKRLNELKKAEDEQQKKKDEERNVGVADEGKVEEWTAEDAKALQDLMVRLEALTARKAKAAKRKSAATLPGPEGGCFGRVVDIHLVSTAEEARALSWKSHTVLDVWTSIKEMEADGWKIIAVKQPVREVEERKVEDIEERKVQNEEDIEEGEVVDDAAIGVADV